MSTTKQVLVTGGSGYLGSYLIRELQSQAIGFTASTWTSPVAHADTVKMDIRDEQSVNTCFDIVKPRFVINLAANNPVRGPEEMESVNAIGTSNLAKAAKLHGARIVHISSDVVHDGKNPPYDESAVPSATSLYGKSKAQAESAILKNIDDYVIIRTSLIYGTDQMDRGTQIFANKLENNEAVTFFEDVLRQPVWVNSLVQAILELLDHEYIGILNVAGSELVSRDFYGRQLLRHFGIPGLDAISTGLGSEIAPSMPSNTSLDLSLAQSILKTPLPGLTAVLKAT